VPYSIDDLRKARDQKADGGDLLSRTPPQAPHTTVDAIGFWNGLAFVSWREWVLSEIRRQSQSWCANAAKR
jgi:hypothetical protein